MEFDPREDLQPFQQAHLLHPMQQVPTELILTIRRIATDGNLGASYLEARQEDSGLTYDFYWLTDRVIGHARGHSPDLRWPTYPVNHGVERTIDCDIWPVQLIAQISVRNPTVWKDDFSGFNIETSVTVTLVDGTVLEIGLVDPRDPELRKRREAIIDALLKTVGKTVR